MTYVPAPGVPPDLWFNPLSLLADAIGNADPGFVFWFNALGDTSGSSILDTAQFCALGPPNLPDMNAANLQAYGVLPLFALWMQSYLFEQICVSQ